MERVVRCRVHLYLSWSVLKRVLRSCFTAWRSASLPSAENASEYAAPFPPAFWLAEPISFGFCPSAAGRLLGASSSACFRAAALVLAKPAARSDFDAHAHAAPQGWTPSDARQRHAGNTLVLHLLLGRSAGEQQWRVCPVACLFQKYFSPPPLPMYGQILLQHMGASHQAGWRKSSPAG